MEGDRQVGSSKPIQSIEIVATGKQGEHTCTSALLYRRRETIGEWALIGSCKGSTGTEGRTSSLQQHYCHHHQCSTAMDRGRQILQNTMCDAPLTATFCNWSFACSCLLRRVWGVSLCCHGHANSECKCLAVLYYARASLKVTVEISRAHKQRLLGRFPSLPVSRGGAGKQTCLRGSDVGCGGRAFFPRRRGMCQDLTMSHFSLCRGVSARGTRFGSGNEPCHTSAALISPLMVCLRS